MFDARDIDALVASGCTVEQLASFVKFHLTVQDEKALKRRADGRARQRRYVERGKKLKDEQNQQTHDANDASSPVMTGNDVSAKEGLPHTPSKENIIYTYHPSDGAEASPKQVIWSVGIGLLERLSGKQGPPVRRLMGKLLGSAGDDAIKVMNVLRQAEIEQPVDPIPWITARLKPKPKPLTFRQQNVQIYQERLARVEEFGFSDDDHKSEIGSPLGSSDAQSVPAYGGTPFRGFYRGAG